MSDRVIKNSSKFSGAYACRSSNAEMVTEIEFWWDHPCRDDPRFGLRIAAADQFHDRVAFVL